MDYGSCGHKCYGNRTTIVRFMKSKTVRWLQGNREVTVRRPHGSCSYISLPYGRLKDAVRPPYDFLGTQDRLETVCPLTATVRWPCGVVATLRFLKKFNVKLKKTQGLRWPCGVLKTVRSPCGLYKKRKVAVRFRGLRSPYGRCKLYVTMA